MKSIMLKLVYGQMMPSEKGKIAWNGLLLCPQTVEWQFQAIFSFPATSLTARIFIRLVLAFGFAITEKLFLDTLAVTAW